MMVWRSWNRADRTLLLAAVLFLFALCLRLQYPASVLARGILFCTEAALVGGIADWFAVTALFRRPLGFSWHTAILPRRRAAFIEAAVTMVQQEFFSKKKLFRLIHQTDLLLPLQKWLEKEPNQELAADYLMSLWKSVDKSALAQEAAGPAARQLQQLLREAGDKVSLADWLQSEERGQKLLAQLAVALQPKAAAPAVREEIHRYLQLYQQQKTGSGLGAFFANLAQTMDLVNLDEAAELLQQQLVGILADLSVSGSSAQQRVLSVLFEKLIILQKDTFFRQGFDRIITNLIQENLVKEYLAAVMKATVDSPDHLYTVLRGILQEIIQDWLGELHEDDQLQQKINRFLYDLTARSVLQAQSMIGDIIRSVLGRMTDQQLNQLVYDKVDTDLQWIRMNGSIVGAGIGLGLFLVLQMVQRFG